MRDPLDDNKAERPEPRNSSLAMKKKKQLRNIVVLEVGNKGEQRGIKLVDGPRPYLWIGPVQYGSTFGVVADDDVWRLRRLCDRVLAKRRSFKREEV